MQEVESNRFRDKIEDGREYTIIEYQLFVRAPSFTEPNAEVAGKPRLATSTGLTVTSIDSETFKIVQTDEIIRKV